MAQAAISDEINRHVEAVLVLSKRDILWRLIIEAELCVELQQVSAAAILAGIALEELSSLGDLNMVRAGTVDAWRDLRNRVAHPASSQEEMDPKAVAAMVSGIRAILDQTEETHWKINGTPRPEATVTKVRGKYAFVPTSVDDFLKRKRQDLELENRE